MKIDQSVAKDRGGSFPLIKLKGILTSLAVALSLTLSSGVGYAQTLTYGLVVGTALTNDLGRKTTFFINPVTGNINDFTETPASRGFIMGGGLIEWHASQHISIETNALYRALHFNQTQLGPRDTVVTWQVPVLLKYSLKETKVLQPFVELGPTFRFSGNLNGTNPSHAGLSTGVGLNIHLGFLEVAPGVRYTRWLTDTGSLLYLTKSDQVELLVNLTHTFNHHVKQP